MGGFVDSWNSLSGDYEEIYILCHGYPGGLSCAGESIENSGRDAYAFWDLGTVSANRVNLYSCNGGTFNEKGNSVAMHLSQLTGGSVWAVANGYLGYALFSHTPIPKKGGAWSVTYSGVTTVFN